MKQRIFLEENKANFVEATINDTIGFHVRTASIVAKKAQIFHSEILICYGEKKANAKSMLALIALGAKGGARIKIFAYGNDAEAALRGLKNVVETGI